MQPATTQQDVSKRSEARKWIARKTRATYVSACRIVKATIFGLTLLIIGVLYVESNVPWNLRLTSLAYSLHIAPREMLLVAEQLNAVHHTQPHRTLKAWQNPYHGI
ncbi:MAG TPA: hypothetical protein VMV50_03715 [Candidatus Paceibacterota bacterium]|nr:hypothetical protein [Candidatus Paceibacterota bacterium]